MPASAMETATLGAVPVAGGVRFTLYSRHATAVELSLFDEPGSAVAARRVALEHGGGGVWSVEVPGVGPGQLYGYRVHGPYEPHHGHRFNAAKLLVDPWARAITGEPAHEPSIFGYGDRARPDHTFDGRDSAAAMPKCVVVDGAFDWQDDRPPRVPWGDTVIYECHLRGLTRLHPEVDERLRGTYLGLAAPPVVDHLRRLGVTTVEPLPLFQIAREPHLAARGLANYWGYSPLGFFAPHAGYATGGRGEQVAEFKTMVRELHRAGLEVILDVVYNHTAEGDHLGPTVAFRGIDNLTYYRLRRRRPARYVDWTGCGNTLDLEQDAVREMVLASLRYWALEMHVDGFRFDLATALGRQGTAFDPGGPLLTAIAEDPVLAAVKLVAEPWDMGPGGYRLGRFPPPWAEWNDRCRDAVRRFWRGDAGAAGELATRLAGSEDFFAPRGPSAGVNFVTCHDGFTLRDLVSYERKRNEANGEGNRDGRDADLSRNWGAEGPTDDPGIRRLRDRARRNLLATVLLSRGVPLLLHGDELGRTQAGNNNAYCQDNEISWVDWTADDEGFADFVARLTQLRRRLPELRRESFTHDLRWSRPDGGDMTPADWHAARAFAMRAPRQDGELLLLVNGGDHEAVFHGIAGEWTELLDTARPEAEQTRAAPPLALAPHSLRLFLRAP